MSRLSLRNGKKILRQLEEQTPDEETEDETLPSIKEENEDSEDNSFISLPDTLDADILKDNKIPNMSKLNTDFALKIIPTFDGTASQLHRFLNCCEVVHKKLTSDDDKSLFLSIVQTKLTDKAYEVIKYTEYENYSDLKSELQKQFLEKRTLELIQNELVTIKQKPREEDLDFANRVERLLADLNSACSNTNNSQLPDPIKELNNRTALRAYQEGLRQPLKLFIKACRFTTLKEAIESALIEGKSTPQQVAYHENKSKYCGHCKSNTHSFSECRNKSRIQCSNCQRIGHSATQCRISKPFNKTNNSLNSPTTSQNNSNKVNYSATNNSYNNRYNNERRIHQTNICCKYCKRYGHSIEECRRRPYRDNAQEISKPISSTASENEQGSTSRDQVPAQQLIN